MKVLEEIFKSPGFFIDFCFRFEHAFLLVLVLSNHWSERRLKKGYLIPKSVVYREVPKTTWHLFGMWVIIMKSFEIEIPYTILMRSKSIILKHLYHTIPY